MKLHRDIGVTQKTAWFMIHRIREAWSERDDNDDFSGPIEVAETFFGEAGQHVEPKRKELKGTGRGPVGTTAVVGLKDRERKNVQCQSCSFD